MSNRGAAIYQQTHQSRFMSLVCLLLCLTLNLQWLTATATWTQRTSSDAVNHELQTDPRFADYKTWINSDVLIQALGQQPNNVLQRLGDGFYEQKLVQEQIIAATGQRFTGDYTSNETQYKDLLLSGAEFASKQGKAGYPLSLGVALTEAQMRNLTTDIVWLVEQTIQLPNGQTAQALVPQVYLRVKPGDLKGDGSLIAGRDINLNLTGDLNNSGTIAGRNSTFISAENINNQAKDPNARGVDGSAANNPALGGRITGNVISLTAKQDINNIGGQILGTQSAGQDASTAQLKAGRDILVASTTQSTSADTRNAAGVGTLSTRSAIDQVGTIQAGNVAMFAGRDLTIAGASVSATSGNLILSADRNVKLAVIDTAQQTNINFGSNRAGGNTLNQGSTTQVGSQLGAAGQVYISAGRQATPAVEAKPATYNPDGSLKTAAVEAVAAQQGTMGDFTATGAAIKAGGAVTINATGNIELLTAKNTTNYAAQFSSASSGFLTKTKTTRSDTLDTLTNAGTTIVSTGTGSSTVNQTVIGADGKPTTVAVTTDNAGTGTVSMSANGNMTLTSAQIQSKDATTLAAGGNLIVTTAQDTRKETHYASSEKSGLMVSLPTLTDINKAGISFGKTARDSDSASTTTQVASNIGSTGGNTTLLAQGGTLAILGSNVSAGKDVALQGQQVIVASTLNVETTSAEQFRKDTNIHAGIVAVGKGILSKSTDGQDQTATRLAQASVTGQNVSIKATGKPNVQLLDTDGKPMVDDKGQPVYAPSGITLAAANITVNGTNSATNPAGSAGNNGKLALDAGTGALNLNLVETTTVTATTHKNRDLVYQKQADKGATTETAHYTQLNVDLTQLGNLTITTGQKSGKPEDAAKDANVGINVQIGNTLATSGKSANVPTANKPAAPSTAPTIGPNTAPASNGAPSIPNAGTASAAPSASTIAALAAQPGMAYLGALMGVAPGATPTPASSLSSALASTIGTGATASAASAALSAVTGTPATPTAAKPSATLTLIDGATGKAVPLNSPSPVQWQQVNQAAHNWEYKKQGLTQEGAVIVALVVAFCTAGAASGASAALVASATGSAVVAGTAAAAASAALAAGMTTLATQAAVSLINNQGNLSATLQDLGSKENVKGLLTSMVTAGVVSGLGSAITIPNGAGGSIPLSSINATSSFGQQLTANIINNTAGAVVNSAINGTDLRTSLQNGLVSALITTGAAQGANAIGDAATGRIDPATGLNIPPAIDRFAQFTAHAIVGCMAGAATNASTGGAQGSNASACGAGALGGIIGEATAMMTGGNTAGLSPSELATANARTVALSSLMGGVAVAVTGGNAAQINQAAASGANAAANNYLNHDQWDKLAKELTACKAAGKDCSAIVTQYQALSNKQDAEMRSTCDADINSPACRNIVNQAAAGTATQKELASARLLPENYLAGSDLNASANLYVRRAMVTDITTACTKSPECVARGDTAKMVAGVIAAGVITGGAGLTALAPEIAAWVLANAPLANSLGIITAETAAAITTGAVTVGSVAEGLAAKAARAAKTAELGTTGAVKGFRSAEELNGLMSTYGKSPAWREGTQVAETTMAPGTMVQMVVDKVAFEAIRKGDLNYVGNWATFEKVTNQSFARNNLAITSEFKKDVGYVVELEIVKPLNAQIGIVGSQGAAAGGANQLNFMFLPKQGAEYFRLVGGKVLP
jgi:filamentous hemagglutinin